MEQKTSDQLVHSSEHPDSPDMHCNEAYVCSYSASDENLLSGVSAKPSPVMHSGKIDDAKHVTPVLSGQVNVAASTSHTETEYSYVDDTMSELPQVASAHRTLALENSLADSLDPKRLSMSNTNYSKLEHPVGIPSGTKPLGAGYSTFKQSTVTVTPTATSPTKPMSKSGIDDVLLFQPAHSSQAGLSQLSLSLHKTLCDTHQQSQHSQGQSCHVQTMHTFGEVETKTVEHKVPVPKLLVDQFVTDGLTCTLQQSKLTACMYILYHLLPNST